MTALKVISLVLLIYDRATSSGGYRNCLEGGGGVKAGERQFIKSTKVIQRAVARTELGNISHEIDTCTS